ncbi:MAG: hypothetical protein AB1752_06800 [Candidatus Zixiibacteriota bacterium]
MRSDHVKLSGQHAAKLFMSTELKTRVLAVAEAMDRSFADTCRHLMWMGLPVIEGMLQAHDRGSRWWLGRVMGEDGKVEGEREE